MGTGRHVAVALWYQGFAYEAVDEAALLAGCALPDLFSDSGRG